MDTSPSTHYHSRSVQEFNRDNSEVAARIVLSEQALLTEARRESGFDQFDDLSFGPGLRVLLKSLNEEAQLNAFGRFNAWTRSLRSLKNRLWADACFRAHPEIRKTKIAAPIIIVGAHRSGTTRMQRMLASDARLQHLKTWEGINPAPRIGMPNFGHAERFEEVRLMLAGGREIYPGAFTAHPMEADWPEEEMLLLNHSFCSFSLLGLFNIPTYYRWFLSADKTSAYRYMADLMRLISWSRGDPENKRWVLKNPQHMLDLDVLLKVFPDAKLVFTHRDPLKTVGSVMSLMWFYTVQHTDLPCRAAVRDIWLDFCEQMPRRCIEAREGIPVPQSQQLDIHYEDMNRDWRAAMRRLYDFAGIDFSPDAEQAQAAWLAASAAGNHHGSHRYSLEDFGVSDEDVDRRMMFVREKYAIPYEGK